MPELYIVLTDTGTLFSRCIGWCTRQPLNHASVAFDSSLRELYSFGRKQPGNAFRGGFVRERALGSLVRDAERATPCAVFRCAVREDQYRAIRETVRRMSRDAEAYGYNFAGLFALLAGIDWHRSHAFFCSQFVLEAYRQAGAPLSDVDPRWVSPADLLHMREGDVATLAASRPLRYVGHLKYTAPTVAVSDAP